MSAFFSCNHAVKAGVNFFFFSMADISIWEEVIQLKSVYGRLFSLFSFTKEKKNATTSSAHLRINGNK